MVETAQDILEELHFPGATTAAETRSGGPASADDTVLTALGFDPATLDAMAARTGWSASALNIRLLELELSGHVTRLPGQLFQRLAPG